MTLLQIEELLIQLQTQVTQNAKTIETFKNNYAAKDDVTAISGLMNTLIKDNEQIHTDIATLSASISKIDHLEKLNDISVTSLSQGDILQYDADKGKWCNVKTVISVSGEDLGESITKLSDLYDVQISSLVNGHCLVYNSAVGKWMNSAISTGNGNNIDLSNYLTKSAADGMYLPKSGGTITGDLTINKTLNVDGLTTINNDLLVKGGITMYKQ